MIGNRDLNASITAGVAPVLPLSTTMSSQISDGGITSAVIEERASSSCRCRLRVQMMTEQSIGSRAAAAAKIFDGSRHAIGYFVLKGKPDNGKYRFEPERSSLIAAFISQ